MGRCFAALFFALGALAAGGCLTVRHTVPEPIHITVDVNVRVQQELKDFFSDIDNL